jgi:hypothetical protein
MLDAVHLGEGKFAGAVDGHEQVELALFGPDLGDVDVKVANRVALEGLLGLFPPTSGNRLTPWRWRQRCSAERVRCGIVACSA